MKKSKSVVGLFVVLLLMMGVIVFYWNNKEQKLLTQRVRDRGIASVCSQNSLNQLISNEINKEQRQNFFYMLLNKCSSEVENVSGILEVYLSEDFDNFSSKLYYFLNEPNGNKLALFTINDVVTADINSNDEIQLSGLRINNGFYFDDKKIQLQSKSIQKNDPAIGEKKTLVLLTYFKNQEKPTEDINIWQVMMRETDSYIRQTSYNKYKLVSVVDEGQSADVRGWYQLPFEQNCGWIFDVRYLTKILPKDINLDLYSQLFVVADFEVKFDQVDYYTECALWGGKAFTRISPVMTNNGLVKINIAVIKRSVNDFRIFAHEFGHGEGLLHANFLNCDYLSLPTEEKNFTNECKISEYSNSFDVMGSGFYTTHYNGFHKEKLGWFSQNDIVTLQEQGNRRIILRPLSSFLEGTKFIKIPVGSNKYLGLEFRQPLNGDIGPHSEDPGLWAYLGVIITTDGYLLYNNNEHSGDNLLINPEAATDGDRNSKHRVLIEGKSFEMQAGNGDNIRIYVSDVVIDENDRNNSSVAVEISIIPNI